MNRLLLAVVLLSIGTLVSYLQSSALRVRGVGAGSPVRCDADWDCPWQICGSILTLQKGYRPHCNLVTRTCVCAEPTDFESTIIRPEKISER